MGGQIGSAFCPGLNIFGFPLCPLDTLPEHLAIHLSSLADLFANLLLSLFNKEQAQSISFKRNSLRRELVEVPLVDKLDQGDAAPAVIAAKA